MHIVPVGAIVGQAHLLRENAALGGNVTLLVLQEDFRDHTGSLDNPNMDIQSKLMKYHSEFIFGSTFRICSGIGNISITLPSYQ